jgi:hypothetical protein
LDDDALCEGTDHLRCGSPNEGKRKKILSTSTATQLIPLLLHLTRMRLLLLSAASDINKPLAGSGHRPCRNGRPQIVFRL